MIEQASKYIGLGQGQKFNPKKAKVVDDDELHYLQQYDHETDYTSELLTNDASKEIMSLIVMQNDDNIDLSFGTFEQNDAYVDQVVYELDDFIVREQDYLN